VFTQETAVFLGGKEARARHFGRGHTNGDAIIYFPALRTIHTGDLMSGTSPLIDYPGGGSVVEWTKTLDAAMKLDFDTVIPGHGKVTNKAGLLAYRDNVEKLRNRVSGLIHEARVRTRSARWSWRNMAGPHQPQYAVEPAGNDEGAE
jgi:glyoxylase-like metal-dependent hydrolase (beta-lactamase superfamily II)